MNKTQQMMYRRLGNSGLKVSVISYGNMLNYRQETKQQDTQIIKKCIQYGINYFDTAQLYANGQAQQRLGKIIKQLDVSRQSIIVGTKIWKAPQQQINSNKTLNKKHILQSIKGSLKRLQLEYVDIIFAHAYDPNTPLQQICYSFNDIIEQGLTFYWGTSNWDADIVYEALAICQKNNLHKPICAQNQYNMLNRVQNQNEYESLFQKYKYGLMSWSPLLGGFLSGKYLNGVDQKQLTRLTDNYVTQKQELKKVYYYPYADEQTKSKLLQIQKIAKQQINCTMAQLALAWCLKFKYLSTAVIGARNVQQLEENLKAIQITKSINSQIQAKNLVNTIKQSKTKYQVCLKTIKFQTIQKNYKLILKIDFKFVQIKLKQKKRKKSNIKTIQIKINDLKYIKSGIDSNLILLILITFLFPNYYLI